MSTGSTGSTFDPQQALSQHVLNNFYIGGEWVTPQSNRKLELVSPVTEECFLKVPEASERTSIAQSAPHAKRSTTVRGRA